MDNSGLFGKNAENIFGCIGIIFILYPGKIGLDSQAAIYNRYGEFSQTMKCEVGLFIIYGTGRYISTAPFLCPPQYGI